LEQLNSNIQLVGINNRNLKTFEVDLEQSMRLAAQLPSDVVTVAESGIASIEDYFKLKNAGFKAFLMGEYFMKQPNAAEACMQFCEAVRKGA
jgi:indole-3-glycerol phosphate synthase